MVSQFLGKWSSQDWNVVTNYWACKNYAAKLMQIVK